MCPLFLYHLNVQKKTQKGTFLTLHLCSQSQYYQDSQKVKIKNLIILWRFLDIWKIFVILKLLHIKAISGMLKGQTPRTAALDRSNAARPVAQRLSLNGKVRGLAFFIKNQNGNMWGIPATPHLVKPPGRKITLANLNLSTIQQT